MVCFLQRDGLYHAIELFQSIVLKLQIRTLCVSTLELTISVASTQGSSAHGDLV